jgi:large subunit ribosomal protein L1
MKKLSNRRKKIVANLKSEPVSFTEAIKLVKETATAKFVESIEAHVTLAIDPKYNDQQLRTTLVLPEGSGKTKKLAVLVSEDQLSNDYSDLAHRVGSEDLVESISAGETDFDVLITTPDMMPKLAKLGKVLGPKGLMPSPKAGTVTTNILETLTEFKKGKLEYRADKTGIVHIGFGRADFSTEALENNLLSVYNSIEQNKPSGVKGRYFKSFYICSTMGPSIQVDLTSFKVN